MLGLIPLIATEPFDREIIAMCVRWYLRFKLSLRDLVEMMAVYLRGASKLLCLEQ